jgi:hypothetical protein
MVSSSSPTQQPGVRIRAVGGPHETVCERGGFDKIDITWPHGAGSAYCWLALLIKSVFHTEFRSNTLLKVALLGVVDESIGVLFALIFNLSTRLSQGLLPTPV